MPELFAWAASLSEFIGGLFIAMGLMTRPMAGLLLFTMLVAAFGQHGADPYQKKEMALLYAAISLYFFLRGSNSYSVDSRIK